MAHEIHIATVLAYLLGFEIGSFLVISAIMLTKWTRYYSNFRLAFGVVFTSEVRIEFALYFIVLNVLGFVLFVIWLVVHLLGLNFSW